MKIAIVVLSLAFVLCVNAETCPNGNVSECTDDSFSCSNGFHKSCVDNICTCNPNEAMSCNYQSDCTGNCGRTWHCVDNLCRCGGNFPGRR